MIQFLWKILFRLSNPTCTIKAASVSRNVKLEKGVTLEEGSSICADLIGRHTYINKYCMIDKGTSSIGRFCSIAYGVKIGLGGHPVDWVSTHPFAYSKKYGFVKHDRKFETNEHQGTVIGNDVWIGANAIVLAGVTVGDGAIIGANALVNKDVEPYSIVVGSPAKELRKRFDEPVIIKLLDLKWWNWEDEEIRGRVSDFDADSVFLKEPMG